MLFYWFKLPSESHRKFSYGENNTFIYMHSAADGWFKFNYRTRCSTSLVYKLFVRNNTCTVHWSSVWSDFYQTGRNKCNKAKEKYLSSYCLIYILWYQIMINWPQKLIQLPLTIERQGLSQCIQPLQQFVCAHFISLFCQLQEFLIVNEIIVH